MSESWIDYEAAQVYAGCAKRYYRHSPLIENLERMFGYVTDTLLTLCNYRYGVHLFLNRTLPEAHVLVTTGDERKYQKKWLTDAANFELRTLVKQQTAGQDFVGGPIFSVATADMLAKGAQLLTTPLHEPDASLIIPFDFDDWNLGMFILWGHGSGTRSQRGPDDETLRGWIASYYSFLGQLLAREFAITQDTYLPSFYSSRWSPATIMFADIRGFTPLTEILRNRQATGVFSTILGRYCEEMAKIIQGEAFGRIDKFLGDGIMAIFGEHVINPSKSVCRAIYAATRMVTRFDDLRRDILESAFGKDFDTEYNEGVDLRLGVGINYGTVLFDYLGDTQHREYTAIGDHVNFAQRLESAAARADSPDGDPKPPILISATAERCARPWLKEVQRIALSAKGKGLPYTVYGLEPKGFHERLYRQSETNGDWITPWGSDQPPKTPVEIEAEEARRPASH